MSLFQDFRGKVKVIGAVIFITTLLAMAGIEQNPGPKDIFVFRYQYLLIEVGTQVLRQVFNNIVGNDFMRYLNTNPTQYTQLRFLMNKDIITDAQKKLLPPDDMEPTSSNFEITLLTLLLRTVCGLLDRRNPVWITPATGDLSVEADITRLRVCRNNLLHSATYFILDADLDCHWKELCQILTRLNMVAQISNLTPLINNVKQMSFGVEENKDVEMKLGQGQSIFRYLYMVIDIGTNVLRQLIESKVGRDFRTYLKSLSVEQKMLLHVPPLEKNPDLSKFDLPLLTNLWRNVCGLLPSTNSVRQNPKSTDMSMEADITRLCNCTNKMMHGPTFLTEEELDIRIVNVTMILHRLSTGNRDLLDTVIHAQKLSLDQVVPDNHTIRGDISNQPLEPEIPEINLRRLTSLSLYGIKMEHNSFKNMVEYLSSNVRIQNLNLSYVSCYHHQDNDTYCTSTLNLQINAKLTSLCLYGVNIVCDRVNRSSLRSIKLYPVSKRINGSYITVFNCIEGSHLEHLHIHGSLARYEGNTLESLTSAVKTLRNIKSLKLSSINLPDNVSLQLHRDVKHAKIVLEYVTMSKECFHSFTSNCVNAISEARVEFICCTITPVGEINSCFEELVNDATEISHLKLWQNTVHYICKYFTTDIQVSRRDTCCLYYKSTRRN